MSENRNALDLEKLGAYLEGDIQGFTKLLSAEKFQGGQSNPTYLLTTENSKYVLRRKPAGVLLKSAHAVDREFRVIRALSNTEVPVPQALHLCEDDDVIGSMFFVMSYEEGNIYWDPALPELDKDLRASYYKEIIRVMAAMHEVDLEKVELSDYGKPGNYFERQISRWTKQYRLSETHKIDAIEKLISWLPENIPADDGSVRLIHGDLRLDNLIFETGKSRVKAILDWELSTLGHPLADLAYFCMCLRLPRKGVIQGLAGLDREEDGIPKEQELVSDYCNQRGMEQIPDWNFYLAFSFFRLASICQGVYKRTLDGNASSDSGHEVGKMAENLAEMGLELIET